jgi:hypothetical protein
MMEDEKMNQRDGYAYKCAPPPWSSLPAVDSDATIFHAEQTDNAAPQVRQFAGTVNLGFTINAQKHNNMNGALLLKHVMSFTKQTDADFRIKPLNGSAQCISNPSNIPTSKDGVELYYQHRIVADGIRGKIIMTMSKTMLDVKVPATHFRKYLNQDKIYFSLASLELVDARIIGVMLQTYPQLTFFISIFNK